MDTYESLAEQLLSSMDTHRHMPPEPVSATIRGEMAVLRLLGQDNIGMNAGFIATELNMTTSRIAAVLNSLEKKNLILRTSDPDDKRRVMVCLTEQGIEYHQMKRKEAKAHLTGILSRLSMKDAQAFVRITGQLLGFTCTLNETDKEI